MVKSIRFRMQVWYAMVLLGVIGSFAALLYARAHAATIQRADGQLLAATRYLEATLRNFPPHELDPSLPAESLRGRPPRDGLDNGPPDRGQQPRPALPPRRPDDRRPDDRRPDDRRPDAGPPGDRATVAPLDERLTADGPPDDRAPPDRPPDDFRGDGPPQRFDNRRPLDDGPPERGNRPQPKKDLQFMLSELDLHDVRDVQFDDPIKPTYFTIWRADGAVLKTSDATREFTKPDIAADRVGSNDLHYAFVGPERQATTLGPMQTIILVGKPMQRELADLRWLTWQLLGVGSVVLLIGVAGGWLIAGRLIRPIQSIATTASSISAQNLARRIDASLIDDELVVLADVLNEMFSRLEGSFDRQTRFTADASHELRTPLAVLHSHLELALSRPRTTAAYQETLRTCLTACGRMRALVDGLLTLARADAGKLELQFKPLDIRVVVRDVTEQFLGQAEQSGVSLSLSVPPQPLRVAGDAVFLARVPANLLANALRHTPRGGKVRVSLTAADQHALLTIADNGSGIPEADQSRVFERFFRADQARSRASGGCGLGLAICKSLIEAHGGTISFSSQTDRGTTFTVRLPLAPAAPSPPSPPRIEATATPPLIAHNTADVR